MQNCELPKHKKKPVEAVGRFQVYDDEMNVATMDRPAWMCQGCVNFAKQCGMSPRLEADNGEGAE